MHCLITFFLHPLHWNQCEMKIIAVAIDFVCRAWSTRTTEYIIWICAPQDFFFDFWSLKNENAFKFIQFKCPVSALCSKIRFQFVSFFRMSNSSQLKFISTKLWKQVFKSQKTFNHWFLQRNASTIHTFRSKEFLMDAQQFQVMNATMIARYFLLCLM